MANELTLDYLVIDGHNDLPWALRMQAGGDAGAVDLTVPPAAGGLGAQFWSVYVPSRLAGDSAVTAVLEQIDLTKAMIAAWPSRFELALTADDVQRVFAAGRIASL